MRGIEIGIERVLGRIRIASFVEIEAFVVENLVQQMEQGVLDPSPIWTNLKTFDYEAFHGKIHGIIGGYPCQPFSHAGVRKGADDPRHLWPFIRRGIKKSRPLWVFFENVEGHLSLGLRDVLTDLRKLGYQVEVGLFSAAEVGAPHRRNRVFILGMENSFLLRMRGWSDEERAHRKREIQTPRSSELDYTCGNGLGSEYEISAGRNGAELAGEAGLENTEGIGCGSRRSKSEGFQREPITDNASKSMGDPEHPGSQRKDAIRESAKPTKSGLLELSGLANADDNGQQQFERLFGEIRERAGHGGKDSGSVADTNISEQGQGRGDDEEMRGLPPEERRTENSAIVSGGDGDQSSGRLANTAVIGVEGNWPEGVGVTEISTGETISGCDGGGDRWPARPGEPQHDWEAPRLEPSVDYIVNGYNYREDLLRMAGNAVVPAQSEKAFRTLLLKFIK